jgi:predicted Rossmann-fold nucleotide-binding protein
MAAMNEGAEQAGGHIVGVIHEMFVVDGSDWADTADGGGAHAIFRGASKREIQVAGGSDLQERKRLLVEGADALVVLPGGPGTWDELWEMACVRHLGLREIPIVCVNVEGYYDPFQTMLQRAWEDQLIQRKPHEVVHFEPTSKAAIQWIEQQQKDETSSPNHSKVKVRGEGGAALKTSNWQRNEALRSSMWSSPVEWMGFMTSPSDHSSNGSSPILDEDGKLRRRDEATIPSWNTGHVALTFAAGLALGVAVATRGTNHSM